MVKSMRIKDKVSRLNRKSKLILPAMVVGGVVFLGGSTVGVLAALGIITPVAVDYNLSLPAAITMQNFASSDCAAMQTYTTLELTDTRGNNQHYRVRKMPDGKCWMIDNLKLGGTGSDILLTSADSDLSYNNDGTANNFRIPASPIVSSATHGNGHCYPNAVWDTAAGHAGSMPGAIDDTAKANGSYLTCNGSSTQSAANSGFAAYVNPADAANTSMSENCAHGAAGLDPDSLSDCGYLYNWFTATAGTGVYDTPADTTANANAAPSSICPAGWRLPKAGTGDINGSNEFATLSAAMYNGAVAADTTSAGRIANWNASGPFSGAYSGRWDSGFGYQGYYGYYWSSSASSPTYARYPGFGYNGVNPGNSISNKNLGYAVRCVI
jgi:uncharacterized protein (TIGR02145 family)